MDILQHCQLRHCNMPRVTGIAVCAELLAKPTCVELLVITYKTILLASFTHSLTDRPLVSHATRQPPRHQYVYPPTRHLYNNEASVQCPIPASTIAWAPYSHLEHSLCCPQFQLWRSNLCQCRILGQGPVKQMD